MQHRSFSAVMRALLFFGIMAAGVGVLTAGAALQLPTDESSATVAALRGRAPVVDEQREFAAAPSAPASLDKARARQAMVERSAGAVILR